MIYYSPSTKSFIPAAWKNDGTYTDASWPLEAVLISEEEQSIYWKQSPPEGKQLGSENGRPAWVDSPLPSLADLAGAERSWRDGELSAVMWLRERHRDQLEIGLPLTLSGEQFTQLMIYIQALRDWPQSPDFPQVEHRPVAPTWLANSTQ